MDLRKEIVTLKDCLGTQNLNIERRLNNSRKSSYRTQCKCHKIWHLKNSKILKTIEKASM